MRKYLALLAFLISSATLAPAARAGLTIEGSVGKGVRVTDQRGWEPTNVMAAVGYQWFMIRPQLGLVGNLGDVKNSKFDLELRPMIGLYPPILPLFARATFAIQNLRDDPKVAVGLSGGIKIGVPVIGLAIFAEAGYLPRFADKTQQIIEGRLGAYWAF